MKKIILFLLLTNFSVLTGQNSLAKIEYSYAEEAFNKKEYKKTLKHLDEVKSLLGSTNARILFLEINALVNTFTIAKNKKEDYELFQKINNLTSLYVSNFENEAPILKLKAIYEIQKKYKSFIIEFENLMKGIDFMNKEDYDNAISFLSIACDAENPAACKNIGLIYKKKYEAISSSITELKNESAAIVNMNNMLSSKNLMIKFFEKAMNLGDSEAKFYVGYEKMFDFNADKNANEIALQLMDEAYNEGFRSIAIKYALANLKLNKEGKAKSILYEAYKLNLEGSAGLIYLYYKDLDKKLIKQAIKENLEDLEKHSKNGFQHYLRYRLLAYNRKYPEAFIHLEKACEYKIGRACHSVYNILSGDKKYSGYAQKRNKKKSKEYYMQAYGLSAGRNSSGQLLFTKYIYPLY